MSTGIIISLSLSKSGDGYFGHSERELEFPTVFYSEKEMYTMICTVYFIMRVFFKNILILENCIVLDGSQNYMTFLLYRSNNFEVSNNHGSILAANHTLLLSLDDESRASTSTMPPWFISTELPESRARVMPGKSHLLPSRRANIPSRGRNGTANAWVP